MTPEEDDFSFSMVDDGPIRCRGKVGTDKEGKDGQYFGQFHIKDDVWWALVQWDDEDDPDLYKLNLLEVAIVVYKDADKL